MNNLLENSWFLVSFLLIFFELFNSRRIFLFLGLSCFCVGIASEGLGLGDFQSELKVFVAFSIFFLGPIRFITRKISPMTFIETTFKKNSKLYGQDGIVIETIKVARKGRIKIGKKIYLAKTNEKSDLCIGDKIKISGKHKRCFIVDRFVVNPTIL